MNANQILNLVGSLEASLTEPVELVETHISWVILCVDYVYKIKKPLKLSFLDFSTLEKRKHFCNRELELNLRLTTGMYLEVLPIIRNKNEFRIGGESDDIIDYCLKMNRIDNSREMRALLKNDEVKKSDIKKIAKQLVKFHQNSLVIKGLVNDFSLCVDFKDINQINSFIAEHCGISGVNKLTDMLNYVQPFLAKRKERISERDELGYIRDCHGDLHSGNIFLLDIPVIFDCIEFNDHFRHVDLLNELAFLCMDLEFYGRQDLSDYFLEEYLKYNPIIENKVDQELFLFYKLYRCNVKVKVNALKCLQSVKGKIFEERIVLFKRYFEMMLRYFDQLKD